jgi:hypothetical protein
MTDAAPVPDDILAATAALAEPRPMRRGSLTSRLMRCGQRGCACPRDPAARHGPHDDVAAGREATVVGDLLRGAPVRRTCRAPTGPCPGPGARIAGTATTVDRTPVGTRGPATGGHPRGGVDPIVGLQRDARSGAIPRRRFAAPRAKRGISGGRGRSGRPSGPARGRPPRMGPQRAEAAPGRRQWRRGRRRQSGPRPATAVRATIAARSPLPPDRPGPRAGRRTRRVPVSRS